MRIVAQKPIEILRAFIRQHLLQVWTTPDQLPWLHSPDVLLTPIARCFSNAELTTSVDLTSLRKRLLLRCDPDEPTFTVVAGLVPDSTADSLLLLSSDGMPLFAMETSAKRRADGVLQIAGGEAAIVLMTLEQLRARDRRRILDSSTLRSIHLEVFEGAAWRPEKISLQVDTTAAGEMTLSELDD